VQNQSLFVVNNLLSVNMDINARRINYKKMAIVYTVFSDLVVIEAIIPQANIKGL
jgi:hypothetical protein